jgi:hypothetical protein
MQRVTRCAGGTARRRHSRRHSGTLCRCAGAPWLQGLRYKPRGADGGGGRRGGAPIGAEAGQARGIGAGQGSYGALAVVAALLPGLCSGTCRAAAPPLSNLRWQRPACGAPVQLRPGGQVDWGYLKGEVKQYGDLRYDMLSDELDDGPPRRPGGAQAAGAPACRRCMRCACIIVRSACQEARRVLGLAARALGPCVPLTTGCVLAAVLAVGLQGPAADRPRPAASHQRPAASRHLPAASRRLRAASQGHRQVGTSVSWAVVFLECWGYA